METTALDNEHRDGRVDALIDALVEAGTERTHPAGHVLCREDEESDEAYVVLAGTIDARVVGHSGTMTVATHGPRSIVGEVTTLIGGRRTATLVAVESATVAVVSRDGLERVFDELPDAASVILRAAHERTDRSRVAALLSQELQAPDGAVVAAIADRVTWTSIVAGDTLFERGDLADAAYLVVSGRLGVTDLEPSTTPDQMIEVGRGGIVGEFGLLEDRVRGATVVALRDTTLARLSASDFTALTHDHTALAMGLVRRILDRSGVETVASTKKRSFVLAVTTSVGAGERAEIVDAMVDALDICGPTSHLTHSSVDRMLRQDGIADTPQGGFGEVRLAELLHQAETDSDHLVLDTGPGLNRGEAPHWVDRTLHHADQVVVICSPEPDDAESAVIRSVLDATPHGIPRWLALLHPASTTRPSRGLPMRTAFGVDEVHHLRSGSRHDLGRLARLAAGRGVGLVLSGGGARGHAHLGVYAVLCELGVPVDRVVGASMGSIVAGGIGQQLDPDEALRAMLRSADKLLDYTIPLVSLVKGERIVEVLDRQFDGWSLDDMWVPFTCVSTDLTTAEVVVHHEGPVTRAIRASVAIPGVLPPVAMDGHLLADGGVLDNLPAGEFGPRRVDRRDHRQRRRAAARPHGKGGPRVVGVGVEGRTSAARPPSGSADDAQDPTRVRRNSVHRRLPEPGDHAPAVALDRLVAQSRRAPRCRDHRPLPRTRSARHSAARLQPRRARGNSGSRAGSGADRRMARRPRWLPVGAAHCDDRRRARFPRSRE